MGIEVKCGVQRRFAFIARFRSELHDVTERIAQMQMAVEELAWRMEKARQGSRNNSFNKFWKPFFAILQNHSFTLSHALFAQRFTR